MTGLLRAEILRLTSRRLARFAAIAFLAVLLLTQIVAAAKSSKDVEGARAKSVTDAAKADRFGVEICEDAKRRGDIPPEIDCSANVQFQPSNNPDDYYQDPRLVGREWVPGTATGVTVGAAILAFIIGASYVGAEWGAGTMQALLFWEPRRTRVLLAKVLGLVVVVVGFTAAMQLVGWSTAMLASSTRGTTEGLTSGVQQATFLAMLRGFFVASATSLLAFGIAGLARVTGAALGVAFGYFVIVENMIRGLRPGWQRYLFTENIVAVVEKSTEVFPAHPTRGVDVFQQARDTLTGVRGAVTLAVYLLIIVGAFAVSFHRRDVT